MLTLTPHIIRTADITEEDLLPIWVGTEQNITFRGGSPRVESDVEGPFDVETAQDPEEIQDAIRRRLRQLPRGLQDQERGGARRGVRGARGDRSRTAGLPRQGRGRRRCLPARSGSPSESSG